MLPETQLITAGRNSKLYDGAVNPPVYHVSTVLSSTLQEMEEREEAMKADDAKMYYGRKGTPTSWALEESLAQIEGGHKSLLFPSGLAAVSASLLAFLKSGDHLLMVDSVYGPTRYFCDTLLKRFGVETTYYDPLLGARIEELFRSETKVVFTESPGSLTFEVQDIPAIAEVAHQHKAWVLMDNTWASPLFFQAFSHGVDVSIQALTKYVVGHSDAMLGSATANEKAWPVLKNGTFALGQCAGPDDIYLAQRGLRTLSVRLRQHERSSLDIAQWLQSRPEVHQVFHPALPGSPGHDLWKRDFSGACGLFAVELKPCSSEGLSSMLDQMEYFGMGFSWGGFESLILHTNSGIHRTASEKISNPLLRLHIGLESVEDLKADLDAGLKRL